MLTGNNDIDTTAIPTFLEPCEVARRVVMFPAENKVGGHDKQRR